MAKYDFVFRGRPNGSTVPNGGKELNNHTPPRSLLKSNTPSNSVSGLGTPDTIRRATLWAIPFAIALCGLGAIIASNFHLIP